MDKKLSVVVSVYNEEQALPMFYQTTKPILELLDWDYELLFVNDGSSDDSLKLLEILAADDPKVKVVGFSRNFGHEAAMIAGIDYADGDAVVCMDADLQHPPECLPEIVRKLEEGYGVISMVRVSNTSAGILKNITSAAFYKLINTMNTIMCFSNLPLKLGIYAGIFAALLGVAVMIYTLFTRQGAPSGYATIVMLICFMFAILFMIVGIIGEYIAILFSELKDRPVYIVEKTKNIG